jgi:hypothetical protein
MEPDGADLVALVMTVTYPKLGSLWSVGSEGIEPGSYTWLPDVKSGRPSGDLHDESFGVRKFCHPKVSSSESFGVR